MRLHHAHAGAGRPRPVPARAGAAGPAGDATRRRCSKPTCCMGDDAEHDLPRAARSAATSTAWRMRHGEVSRRMFPEYQIDAITNGVHVATWTAPPLRALFDRHMPDWRADNLTACATPLGIPLRGDLARRTRRRSARCSTTCSSAPASQLRPDVRSRSASRAAPPPTSAPTCCSPTSTACSRICRQAGRSRSCSAGKAHPQRRRRQGADPRIHDAGAGAAAGRSRSSTSRTTTWRSARALTSGVDLWLNKPKHAARGVGHQRHEGGAQRRAAAVRARRLVGGRLHRRRHRLGHRDRPDAGRRSQPRERRGRCTTSWSA